MKKWLDNWGRVNVGIFTEENLIEYTEDCLSFYGTKIKRTINKSGPYTWNNLYHPVETALTGVENFQSAIDFLIGINKLDSQSDIVVIAKDKIISFFVHTYSNRKIALKLHELKKVSLSAKKLSILETTLVSYRESFYTHKDKNFSHNIDKKLAFHEVDFIKNMQNAKKNNFILLDENVSLNSVPIATKQKAIINSSRFNFDKKYAFSLDDESYTDLMKHCSSRATRKYIYQYRVSIASNQSNNNDTTLKQLIHWRNKKAKLNGHPNFTDYTTSYAGLGSSASVSTFLDNMKEHIEQSYHEYDAHLKKFAKEHLQMGKSFPWDSIYVREQLNEFMKSKLEIKDIKIDYAKTLTKMFNIAQEMFDIEITKTQSVDLTLWSDCEAYCVKDVNGNILSHIIFDIFHRDNKPTGLIYEYTINPNQKINNLYQPSQQIIVMHLDKGKNHITYTDMVNLFHEFGHALHTLLIKTPYHQKHPFTIEYDAIEFPSQWFELFAVNENFLKEVAYHNGRKISFSKAQKIIEFNNIHKPLNYWTHILHSQIDIHLNTQFKPRGQQTFHQVLAPIFLEFNQKLTKYNHFQNNQFEHFYMGSVYYGYLWAEHMVKLFNRKFSNYSLKEKGKLISQLLHKSLDAAFTTEFTKLVESPYDAALCFECDNKLLKKLI